jgi:hypothetical protein
VRRYVERGSASDSQFSNGLCGASSVNSWVAFWFKRDNSREDQAASHVGVALLPPGFRQHGEVDRLPGHPSKVAYHQGSGSFISRLFVSQGEETIFRQDT